MLGARGMGGCTMLGGTFVAFCAPAVPHIDIANAAAAAINEIFFIIIMCLYSNTANLILMQFKL